MLKSQILIALFLCITMLQGLSQKKNPGSQITVKSNPYNDDYSNITSLSNRAKWGAANVHDPTLLKVDSVYYLFSTDAYYVPWGSVFNDDSTKTDNIQIRTSKDLVNWTFAGWALNSIPAEAVKHVHQFTVGKGADNIWAPYIIKAGDEYRLYYSVSCFGTNSSYIGLAVAKKPLGPWTDRGCVVKTTPSDAMNAIDPSVITDATTQKQWMIYGSYFGGIYCMEINAANGLAQTPDDKGHLVATRANNKNSIIEAPEIIYNPSLKKYFLFVSYDALFTHYNVRVGQSDSPTGPFTDFFGKDMADTTNNYPILTYSYRFRNHPGWSGNGHCAVYNDDGHYYMLHQGRLAPDNLMMQLMVREMHWLPSGWPVVSPERLAGKTNEPITKKDIAGDWEVITLNEIPDHVTLWQGQIPFGGWTYSDIEFNLSETISVSKKGTTSHQQFSNWKLTKNMLIINGIDCTVFRGWDWENQCPTIIFSGINKNGVTVWGKKVNLTSK